MAGNGKLQLDILDVYGDHLRENADIFLRHQTLSDDPSFRGLDVSKTILITNLNQAPQGLYPLEIDAPSYQVVSQFVDIASSGTTAEEFTLPVNPSRVLAVQFPSYASLLDDARRLLEASQKVLGFASQAWRFEFTPIPERLPTMLAISAGATLAATGITQSRGSKGAGPVKPSPADFISTGGLVVGERFQFFVWRLVGCFGFLSLLIRADATTLAGLPKLPDNLLYLMGISSGGYLGGKLARKPGPVIHALSITKVERPAGKPTLHMILSLKGENLSEKATIKVDDKLLRDDQYVITAKKRQEEPPDPTFCTAVDVELTEADDYLEGEYTLTLINRDGQAASVHFPIDPMSIDSVADTPRAAANQAGVRVKGKNFGEGTSASWKDPDPDRTVTPIPADRVTMVSATELTVRMDPEPTPGTGTLTLISPVKLRASKAVTITQ